MSNTATDNRITERQRADEARDRRIIFRTYWHQRHSENNVLVRLMLRALVRRLRELRP